MKRLAPLLLLCLFTTIACRSTYYAVWEQLGREKRDLLRGNVEKARNEQKDASAEFKDALTQLKELTKFDGGKLENAYNGFKDQYDTCVSRADAVRSRIVKVEAIAADLFTEWEKEMNSIANESLRANSRAQLRETKEKYTALHASMKKAEQSMDPVLTQFRDYVLYLKHNLNAQAIGSLKGEAANIELEISKLLQDMNRSIAQADEFIQGMK